MLRVSKAVLDRVIDTYGSFFEPLARVSAEKCSRDVLDEAKVHEQIALLCEVLNEEPQKFLPGKRILEIGSGFCIFLSVTRRDYGMESYGVEPAAEGFDSSFAVGQEILREYGFEPDIVKNASGEALPWPDDYFDLVYSTNVLEHTENPDKVISEALRTLKPGGCAQFIYPNYGSFFEGHYALPWIPHMPKKLAKIWVRLWGRDPAFIDTLQFLTEKDVRRWAELPGLEVIGFGKDIFSDRLIKNNFSSWAGLGLVKKWVTFVHTLGLIALSTKLLLFFRAYTPIIFTCRKRKK